MKNVIASIERGKVKNRLKISFDNQHLAIPVCSIRKEDEIHSMKNMLKHSFSSKLLHKCIDDFKTGYSSLAYLHHFPIDVLKIDRSFVNRIDSDNEQLAIVRAIVTLAGNLGMSVVAEGVETINQLLQLRLLECELAQGYLFSKPCKLNL